jgi:hypothetical protein
MQLVVGPLVSPAWLRFFSKVPLGLVNVSDDVMLGLSAVEHVHLGF